MKSAYELAMERLEESSPQVKVSDEQKAETVSELQSSVAAAIGCAESEVGVVTVDIPSKWNMEGGSLVPEPGEEAAGLERHRS